MNYDCLFLYRVRNRDDDVSPLSKLTVDKVDKMSPGGGVEIADEAGVEAEEVVFCERPLAMVLNDSRAEGKICPVEMTLMTAPLQCTLGSTATFSSEKARQVANQTYHKYEYRLVEPVKEAGLLPKAKLALRIITTMDPKHIKDVIGPERGYEHNQIMFGLTFNFLPTFYIYVKTVFPVNFNTKAQTIVNIPWRQRAR